MRDERRGRRGGGRGVMKNYDEGGEKKKCDWDRERASSCGNK